MFDAVDDLVHEPRLDASAEFGNPLLRRLRVGRYRVLYEIDEDVAPWSSSTSAAWADMQVERRRCQSCSRRKANRMARQLRSLWRLADDAGFDSCWVVDHFASLGERDDGPIFETYGRLAAEAHAALVAYPARHGKHALQAAAA